MSAPPRSPQIASREKSEYVPVPDEVDDGGSCCVSASAARSVGGDDHGDARRQASDGDHGEDERRAAGDSARS